MRTMASYLVQLAFFLFCVTHAFSKPGRQPGDTNGDDLSALQGVWEQISWMDDMGKREDLKNRSFQFAKSVKIFVGEKCYSAHSNGLGGGVRTLNVNLSRDGRTNRLELVNPNDNQTGRCLYYVKDESLTVCVGKTLKWPPKIAPADGFHIHVYKKLAAPPKKIEGDFKKLAGIWETIDFQRDGTTFSREAKDDDTKLEYLEGRKVFYFQEGIFTMVSSEDGELRILHKPYHLIPTTGKNAVDLTTSGDEKYPAIFSRDGDTLTLCWNWSGGARPNTMTTGNGDGRLLYRLRRVDK